MNKVCLLTLMAASMCFASRIGLLKGSNPCPGESVSITLNTEDNDPQTRIVYQWDKGRSIPVGSVPVPGIEIPAHKSTITFKYCVFDVSSFGQYKRPYDYAVLLLDDKCPTESYRVIRHHDTEDHGQNSSYTGNIYPNSVGSNADLHYCYVPKKISRDSYLAGGSTFYPLLGGGDCGLFANDDIAFAGFTGENGRYRYSLIVTEINIDDEDSNNGNSWYYSEEFVSKYGASFPTQKNYFHRMMWDGHNTRMKVAYPKIDADWLRKSAEVKSSSKLVNAELLSAPMVKGIDRSAIAVELKSAGDLKITIANINGAIVVNIVEKNLQAGVHQIKWNSGIIPNGRYIVTVKQNDMTNAKNVILK